jgi:hypothetical protein
MKQFSPLKADRYRLAVLPAWPFAKILAVLSADWQMPQR